MTKITNMLKPTMLPLNSVIGQHRMKKLLAMYIGSYKSEGILPFLNFVGQKGDGKTFVVKKLVESLVKPNGEKPKLIEFNGASFTKKIFFENVLQEWIDSRGVLFVDEVHAMPDDLQKLLLSPLEVSKEPVRTIRNGDQVYEIDFREVCFVSATTDHQLLIPPLQERLREVAFESYTESELIQILELQLDNKLLICDKASARLSSVMRGNPRSAVKIAQDLEKFCTAFGTEYFVEDMFEDFCDIVGFYPLGLTANEVKVLKAIRSKGQMSLNDLAGTTGFSKSVIQRAYEPFIMKCRLMSIDGKRQLTGKGIEYLKELK